MPRPKRGDVSRMSGDEMYEELLKFEAIEKLEVGMERLALSRITPKTVRELLSSPRGGARGSVCVTLSAESQTLLQRVAYETGVPRGRVIDWFLMKLADHYRKTDEQEQKREKKLFGKNKEAGAGDGGDEDEDE